MASSGDGGRALAVAGQGVQAAATVPGQVVRAVAVHGQRAHAAVVPGQGEEAISVECKRELLDSLDYPCTERLRLRRLLSYLREYTSYQIYDVAKDKLGVILHVEDLVKKVKAGQLQEAYDSVRTFASIKESSNESELLAQFLQLLSAISRFADGHIKAAGLFCNWFTSLYMHPALNKYPCFAALVVDALYLRTNRIRSSVDWQLVRNKAAEMVEELVSKAPDLKERTQYPRCPNDVYDVMPIRSSYHRGRRQVKNIGRKQPTDLAQFYLQLKKRLPSGQAKCHDSSGSAWNQGEMLIALIDEALQAGKGVVLNQGHPPEYLSKRDKALQAGKRVVLNQGHPPEYLSKRGFPLAVVLAYKSIPERLREQGYWLQCTSNKGMKHVRLQDTAHPGNDLKRPRTTGDFSELYQQDQDLQEDQLDLNFYRQDFLDLEGFDTNGLLEDLDLGLGSGNAVQAPPDYMDIGMVLHSRNRLGNIVDSLIGIFPSLQFVLPARASLREILEYCNGGIIVGSSRMVYAPSILQSLRRMREALAAFDVELLATNAQCMQYITSINEEVDAFEQNCIQLMTPVGHGHPQNAQPQPQAPPASSLQLAIPENTQTKGDTMHHQPPTEAPKRVHLECCRCSSSSSSCLLSESLK